MELHKAISLIQNKNILPVQPQTWIDLGCGSGLFTQALATLLHKDSTIYAVDKSITPFKKISGSFSVHLLQLDFITEDLNFSNIDGILMANSLHYVKDKPSFIKKILPLVKEDGLILIVEYDTNTPNPWVPYPVSFSTLKELFKATKYQNIEKLHEHPSVYKRANIYSAIIKK
jgi:ubiquinone/menaquinone biosynthesis C-methylase UbiE